MHDHFYQLIDQCREHLQEPISKLSDELAPEIDKLLERNIDTAPNNQMHMRALESINIFSKNKDDIRNVFYRQLLDGFEQFKAHKLSTHIKEEDAKKDSTSSSEGTEAWSLVDDSILEESIGMSTLSGEVSGDNKEKLWQIHQRLRYVNNNMPVDESNNPISPVQFFVALRSALENLPLDTLAKTSCHKGLANILASQYPSILNKVNAYLISQGVLPELNYETQNTGGTVSSSPQIPEEIEGEPEQLPPEDMAPNPEAQSGYNSDTQGGTSGTQGSDTQGGTSQLPIVNTIRNLLRRARNIPSDSATVPIAQKSTSSGDGGGASDGGNTNAGSGRTTPNPAGTDPIVFGLSQIVDAVESIQTSAATAHFLSGDSASDEILQTPTNIAENSARIYNQLYKEAPDGAINAKNMYTIDMVGMLFEYILQDENLPDSIKTLLSHLHTPFLKLAFLDDDFFENKEHKSRMLLDSLAEAGANWVQHDGTSQYDMYNEIKRVVQRVVKEFKNDVTLFAELLMEFNMVKKRVTHMHNLRERNSIEKKQGQEKHELAKTIARQEIKSRIEGRRVPSSIISLLSPWFTYLTFIHLKEGTDSEKWSQALGVIDNLITYCSIKQVKDNSSKLSDGFDQIIEQVKEGLVHVAYNQARASSIIEELEELKNSVLNKRAIRTTETKPSENEGASPQTSAHTPTPEEERVMNYIKLIEPGTWIEYEKRARLKVNGFSSETRKYVLVDQSTNEVIMFSRLEFAQAIIEERATVIDGNAKPLFERALEQIRQSLDKQVLVSSKIAS